MYLAENNALYESNWFFSSQERKDLFQIHGEYAVSVQSRTSRAKCSLQKFFSSSDYIHLTSAWQ